MHFHFIPYGMMLYKRQYIDKTVILRKCMYICERAWKISGFSHCKTAISFNISVGMVGTSDTLSQKHI